MHMRGVGPARWWAFAFDPGELTTGATFLGSAQGVPVDIGQRSTVRRQEWAEEWTVQQRDHGGLRLGVRMTTINGAVPRSKSSNRCID